MNYQSKYSFKADRVKLSYVTIVSAMIGKYLLIADFIK